MKHLKSTSRDLRQLFEKSITAQHVAEPLVSFDTELSCSTVRLFMEKRDYDVVGARRQGLPVGYVKRIDLLEGTIGDHIIEFTQKNLMSADTSLISVFRALKDTSKVFVISVGQVAGIITRGDLQKSPIRMWLFGLISLIEMQLLRLIRDFYPNAEWKEKIHPKRLEEADKLFNQRKKRNGAIDLADCLQLCDKREIIVDNHELREMVGFDSKRSGSRFLEDLETLRNNLAHSQDIITGNWPKIVELADQAEKVLEHCEMAFLVSKSDNTAS